jgi:hypothetical protein
MTTAELEVVEEVEEVELIEPLSKRKAQALHKKIQTAVGQWHTKRDAVLDLLNEAAAGQIHISLGYKSWPAYLADTVQIVPANMEERQELAVAMSAKGLTQRPIAAILGVSQKTIDRDLEGQEFDTDTVTNVDGVEVARNKSTVVEETPEEVEPEAPVKRPPIGQDFGEEIGYLQNCVSGLHDVQADDRYTKARKRIADKYLNELQEIISELNLVVDDLMAV